MTLDDAIVYYDRLADECRQKADIERNDYMDLRDEAIDCRQLADWLNELKVLREKIQLLLEKQELGRWIPVTERLPEKDGRYLITDTTDGAKTQEGYFCRTRDGGPYWGYLHVIAWRKLPEAYKPEEE